MQYFELSDNAARNGLQLGRLAAAVLRQRITGHRRQIEQQRRAARFSRAYLREFKNILRRAAPHWLAEAGGMARGAGVATDDILRLNCPLPPAPPPDAGMHCTTWLSVGGAAVQLLKIRDERNHVQTFYTARLPDGAPLQIARDIGNLGAAHVFSGRPLAGANNTGSHVTLPDEPRLNDCHILRLLAERARNVREIPRLMDWLMTAKLAGGASPTRGAIYTFADAEQGLLVETGADDYSCKFISRGSLVISNHFLLPSARRWQTAAPNRNTLTRRARMAELLTRRRVMPSPRDLFAITRDRRHAPDALCNDDREHFWMTISAQLQVLDRRHPEQSVNYVCCGNTRHSVYFPVPLAFTASFQPLASGRFYMRADRLYRRYQCRTHMAAAQRQFEAEYCAGGDPDPAAAMRAAYRLLQTASGVAP